ncbi:hypothetical protein D0809_11095 [Flavobacterium circumlabens]|uniref:Response regulator n=1 Tax=Flavobacterium circumlabens TaxID=2133765 RepID=A0A4Y7UCY3_9FLAO|nr:hypothetical protein D0809_11095 [Flavobacterium circumlabens]
MTYVASLTSKPKKYSYVQQYQKKEHTTYKDDYKIADVFHIVLSNLDFKYPITVFKNVKLCLKFLKEEPITSPMLFFNLNEKSFKCLDEIVSVRNDRKNKDLPIIVYDPLAKLSNEAIFIAGANIYIKKSNDAVELKKVIKKVINLDWHFESGKFNRETFFVSV